MNRDYLKGDLKQMPQQGSFRAHCDMDKEYWSIRSFRWDGQDLLEILVDPQSKSPVKWTKLSHSEVEELKSKKNISYSLHL